MSLYVGLGNPGSAYCRTRHNIGFMVIDEILGRLRAQEISKRSFEGDLFKTSSHYFLKPQTFMNLSGRSVSVVKQFYKIETVVVIHDDLDLPFGAIRFKMGGGHGGHNGLKSIDASIGKNYLRLRMGIGKPQQNRSVVDHVLGNFSDEEEQHLDSWIDQAIAAIIALDDLGWEDVASQFSKKQITVGNKC